MAIPVDRSELLESIRTQYAKLRGTLEETGPRLGAKAVTDDWDVKQLLAVRVWWTKAITHWISEGKRGRTPVTPAEGFRWKDTPKLNNQIATRAKRTSYKRVREQLQQEYESVLKVVNTLSDEELFEQGKFEWTGTMPLSRWLSINTARQYQTANALIRKMLKRT